MMTENNTTPAQSATMEKTCPVVLRDTPEGAEILAYQHPQTGLQIIRFETNGAIPARESAINTLAHQAGLKTSGTVLDLGKSKGIIKGEAWQFMACTIEGAPEHWEREIEGHTLTFFWQKLDEYLDENEWSIAAIRAIAHVREKVDRMDEKQAKRLMPPRNQDIAHAILALAEERGIGKSLCPSEVSRHMAGSDEKQWRLMMKPVRAEAIHLAHEGKIEITRKGKAVDPSNFKGVYRIKALRE